MQDKIRSFTDLHAWQESHRLVLETYKAIKKFPLEERFGISDQMRRCAVSITSNIAEGFSRRSNKEKTQFYYMALGSVSELQNQLLISRDLKYMSNSDFQSIAEMTVISSKLINGLIKSLKTRTT